MNLGTVEEHGVTADESANPNVGTLDDSEKDDGDDRSGSETESRSGSESESESDKPLIMSTITLKGLQKLSPHDKPSKGDRKTRRKDTKPTNFNFYIEKDRKTTFGPNSTLTSRGRRTGYWLSKTEAERPKYAVEHREDLLK